MKLNSLTPNLMVGDVDQTLKYYIENLGFTLVDTNPEQGPYEWGFVQKDEVGLMFQQEQSLKDEYPQFNNQDVQGSLTFYIRIDGINAFFDEIKEKVEIIKPLNKTFYGATEFAFRDVNGYILTCSETLD